MREGLGAGGPSGGARRITGHDARLAARVLSPTGKARMPTTLRGRLVATGTYDVESHPRFRVLLDGLRSSGWEVTEVVEPLDLSTAERVEVLRRPRLLPRLVLRVLRSWRRLIPRLRRAVRVRPDAVLVGYLGHFDVGLVRAMTRPAPVVLDYLVSGAATALDRGEGGGVKQRALRTLDAWALRCSDIVVVDTAEHAERVPARFADRVVVVPVGADERWFDAGRASARTVNRRLSVVFFGLFTPLQGVPVIARAVRELAGAVDVTIVGSGQDDPEVVPILDGVDGVVRLPWVPGARLPELVARHDVCLGIFGTTDKARLVVPTKVYQGAAAGCALVTSDTEPQRRALGDAAVFVPPGDPVALAEALRSLAADRAECEALGRAARARAERHFAPGEVVSRLETVLESL